MARLNTAAIAPDVRTHGGALAFPHMTPIQALRRSVLSCLLWEREAYESGEQIADRIKKLADQVSDEDLASLAVETRQVHNLRHVPLLLLVALVRKGGPLVAPTIAATLQRADELGELLSLYWADPRNKHMIPRQMRKGLQGAVRKFNEYGLAKYDRDDKVKLRDVLRLARPKPTSDFQRELWGRAVKRELATPDTWEVALSGGADKKETFERLLTEGNLGYLALLRNLRNMYQAGVDPELVKAAILARRNGAERVFPFRYVAAARAASAYEPWLDDALLASIGESTRWEGRTLVLVDVSGSMNRILSAKSDLTRIDAACALASLIPGDVISYTFSSQVKEVEAPRGMAGIDALRKSQPHQSTRLAEAVALANQVPHDRLIVISDEQATSDVANRRLPDPVAPRAYMINVASAQNGVGYGKWVHLDGFSESVLRYIQAYEAEDAA